MNRERINKAIIKVLVINILFYSFSCTPEIEEHQDKITDYNYPPLKPLGYEWKQVNYYGEYGGPTRCIYGTVGETPAFLEINPSPKFRFIEFKSNRTHTDSLNSPLLKIDSTVVAGDSLSSED